AVGTLRDPNQNTFTYTLDQRNRELECQRPDDNQETWKRDDHGQVTEWTDAMGYITSYSYDYDVPCEFPPDYVPPPHLAEADFDDGTSQTYEYDSTFHHVTLAVDNDGNSTTYIYDEDNGDLLEMIDPNEDTTTYEWSDGLETSVTDPRGYPRYYHHDSHRRLTELVDELGDITTYVLVHHGNTPTTETPEGTSFWSVYDNLNRLIQSIDIESVDATEYDYNDFGQLTQTTDPYGYVDANYYDDRGL